MRFFGFEIGKKETPQSAAPTAPLIGEPSPQSAAPTAPLIGEPRGEGEEMRGDNEDGLLTKSYNPSTVASNGPPPLKGEARSEEEGGVQVSEEFWRILGENLSKDAVLGIPPVAAAVNLIAVTCANVKFKLYKEEDGKLTEVEDEREELINGSTGDMLNGFEMKRALLRDYLMCGNGYIYKQMYRNKAEGLYYVDERDVYAVFNEDPIFKRALIYVQGREYRKDEFIVLARNTKNGVTGEGLLSENAASLQLINNILKLISKTALGGGAKRGFFSAKKKLSKESMAALREAIDIFFSTENPRPIVLNEGVEYQSEVQTAAEQQIREIYEDISKQVSEILLVPKCILDGTATKDAYRNWFRSCIIPILNEMSAAFDETLLLEREKNRYFWKADVTEIENGDLKTMLEAYEIASRNNMLDLDEIRAKLGYEPRGFNFIKLGLDTVLYDPDSNTVYTPNTNMVQDMNELGKKGQGDKSGEQGTDPSPSHGSGQGTVRDR